MRPSDLEALRKRVRFAKGSPVYKLLHGAVPFGYSKLRAGVAARRRGATPITATTFWGGTMNLVLPEQVSCGIQRYAFFEEGLSEILIHCLKPGMIFYDVGAHFGYFTLLAAHLVGDSGQVHAFDPTPNTFEILKTNVQLKPNITANQVACYSTQQTLTLTDYGLEFAGHNTVAGGKLRGSARRKVQPTQYTVSAITLDSYAERTGAWPDFIKIDAEGAELEILRGCEQILARKRPTFSLEVGDAGESAASPSVAPVRYLLERGYQAMELRDGQIVRHEVQGRYQYDNLLMVPVQGFNRVGQDSR